jgi:hypothetical protein
MARRRRFLIYASIVLLAGAVLIALHVLARGMRSPWDWAVSMGWAVATGLYAVSIRRGAGRHSPGGGASGGGGG